MTVPHSSASRRPEPFNGGSLTEGIPETIYSIMKIPNTVSVLTSVLIISLIVNVILVYVRCWQRYENQLLKKDCQNWSDFSQFQANQFSNVTEKLNRQIHPQTNSITKGN
jgi:hypothetical protein